MAHDGDGTVVAFESVATNLAAIDTDLRFNDGSYLYDEVRHLAEEVQRELKPYLIRPNEKLGDEEAYTVILFSTKDRSEADETLQRATTAGDG